jgi:aminoglycoside 3-N-acetyltransferase
MTVSDELPRGPLVTVRSLADDLAALGLVPGSTVLVHSSLSSLGWVCGGAPALLAALERALGPAGTVVAPTFTPDLSDPAGWRRPPIPADWWDEVRRSMPPFQPARTPSRNMGALAELVRTQPAAVRSPHPQTSFAALGPLAGTLMREHPPSPRLGSGSPLDAMCRAGAVVLFLGVGWSRNTSFHLAEYRAEYPGRRWAERLVPLDDGTGAVRWWTCRDLVFHEADFEPMGRACLARMPGARTGRVGAAEAMLMPQEELVAASAEWMLAHRRLEGVAG